MARRRVVAWVVVEGPQMRTFRHAAAGMTVEQIVAECRRGAVWAPRGREDAPDAERFTFWCPADRPRTDGEFRVSPIYSIARVPEGAQCHDCAIDLHELHEAMIAPPRVTVLP